MTTLESTTISAADRDDLVAIRRQLHRHPELAFQEVRTAALVGDTLRAIEGIEEIREGVGQTGVIAVIRGTHPGATLLLRADFDALPIQEQTGLPFASEVPGVMHACGHDGHTAILLGVARLLSRQRDRLHGNALLVFQPAEEVGQGAQAMIDDGLWELAPGPVSATLGLHLIPGLPVGTIAVREGATTAAVDSFDIRLLGKGGHGAKPHETVDPVVSAAELVLALQRVVSRETSPQEAVVLSVTRLAAGTAHNVIPGEAHLAGTIRTYGAEMRQAVEEKVRRIVAGVAAAGGLEYEVEIEHHCPSVVSSAEMAALVRQVAAEIVGPERVVEQQPKSVGDDVSYFLEHAPGCYFNVGAGDPRRDMAPNHHPQFDFMEEALPIATAVLGESALRYLSGES